MFWKLLLALPGNNDVGAAVFYFSWFRYLPHSAIKRRKVILKTLFFVRLKILNSFNKKLRAFFNLFHNIFKLSRNENKQQMNWFVCISINSVLANNYYVKHILITSTSAKVTFSVWKSNQHLNNFFSVVICKITQFWFCQLFSFFKLGW